MTLWQLTKNNENKNKKKHQKHIVLPNFENENYIHKGQGMGGGGIHIAQTIHFFHLDLKASITLNKEKV